MLQGSIISVLIIFFFVLELFICLPLSFSMMHAEAGASVVADKAR